MIMNELNSQGRTWIQLLPEGGLRRRLVDVNSIGEAEIIYYQVQ
jgi:hypothetical protein